MCGYSVVNLSVSGASTGTGYTYMWYASTDGGSTWTVASSSASYSTATVAYPSVSTLYRCTVTCAAAGTSANSSSASVTVDKVHGHISFSGTAPDTVSLKVWLVQYNRSAGTLIAVDSTTTCLDSMNAYYSFSGVRADSYLVKAKSLDVTSSIPGSSGYVPTYGASSAHWSGATLVGHASGTTNTQDINMVYGTVTAGPGFVGGLITSGAGKGTAADIPAADMLVFLKNASTGVITQAYTNASGNYSFSSIATGTYFIYPEVMGFATTPSATITLTSSASSFTNINFRQYNDTKRILPFTAGVANVNEANSVVGIYPNPTNGNITLSWNGASGNADVTVADVTGRIVFRTTQVLGTVAGESTIQLPANLAGMYIVKVAGTGFAYTTRLTVQH